MNWLQRLLAAIATHKANAAAHHAKTVLFTSLIDRWTLAQAYRGTADYIMVFQGAGADPVAEAKPTMLTSSGNYTGNSTQNRAIPHGLGVTPKMVFITRADGLMLNMISDQNPDDIFWRHTTNAGNHTLGASMDATNFVIGLLPSYDQTGNLTGEDYYWLAIG